MRDRNGTGEASPGTKRRPVGLRQVAAIGVTVGLAFGGVAISAPANAAEVPTRASATKQVANPIAVSSVMQLVTKQTARTLLGATQGPGFGSATDGGRLFVVAPGVLAACIEPNVSAPMGSTVDGGVQSGVSSMGTQLTPLQNTQVNGAMIQFAPNNTAVDNITGFALAQAVKNRANPTAYDAETHGMGPVWYQTLPGAAAAWTAIMAKYDEINAYMDTLSVPGSTPATGTVDATLQLDPNNNWKGKLFLDAMTVSPATGTLTFDLNGVFAGSGTNTITGTFSAGQVIDLQGTPPAGVDVSGYKFQVSGALTAGSTSPAPAASVHVWTTAGGQTTVSAGATANQQTAMSFTKSDPVARQVPQLSSNAQVLASPGSKGSDVLHVAAKSAAAFPVGGVDLSIDTYLMPGVKPVAGEQPADGRKIASSPVQNTSQAGDFKFSYDVPADATDGSHLVHVGVMKNHATGAVIQQGTFDDKNEWTPVKDVVVVTTPPTNPRPGTATRDNIDVYGWVAPVTTVVVTQFQVPFGEKLTCEPKNQVGTPLAPVAIAEGMNDHTKYLTQWSGSLVAGHSTFVEQTFVNGVLIHTAGCLEEAFDVGSPDTPVTPTRPASTPAQSTPALPVIAG